MWTTNSNEHFFLETAATFLWQNTVYFWASSSHFSESECYVIVEMPTVVFRDSQVRTAWNFLRMWLTSPVIYEVSSMRSKEGISKFSLCTLTLTDAIFTVVTWLLKLLKLVRGLKLQGVFLNIYLYIPALCVCIFSVRKITFSDWKGKTRIVFSSWFKWKPQVLWKICSIFQYIWDFVVTSGKLDNVSIHAQN